MKLLLNKLFTFSLLFLIFITPTFADTLDCSQCSVNQQCECELKLDEGTCASGLLIVLKSEGNSLQVPVIAGIPPTKVSFTPTGEGKIKVMGFCFSTQMPVILKKEIEISSSFLQCPATCKVGENCGCTMGNCMSGFFIGLNKDNNPLAVPVIKGVPPSKIDFVAGANGKIKTMGFCFSVSPPKIEKLEIEITGENLPSTVTRTLSSIAINPNEYLTVTLNVTIEDGESYYLVDEIIPEGLTVVDSGGGSFSQGRLRWAVTENAANRVYKYRLTSSIPRDPAFSGTYMFEGMNAERSIKGDTT